MALALRVSVLSVSGSVFSKAGMQQSLPFCAGFSGSFGKGRKSIIAGFRSILIKSAHPMSGILVPLFDGTNSPLESTNPPAIQISSIIALPPLLPYRHPAGLLRLLRVG
jgi:hypothetical protein